jgi:hypothetical protein
VRYRKPLGLSRRWIWNPLRASRIPGFLSIKYWWRGSIFGYLSDYAAAFGTRQPMLITSTTTLILIILSLVAALIARYRSAVAARSLPSFL